MLVVAEPQAGQKKRGQRHDQIICKDPVAFKRSRQPDSGAGIQGFEAPQAATPHKLKENQSGNLGLKLKE